MNIASPIGPQMCQLNKLKGIQNHEGVYTIFMPHNLATVEKWV